MKSELYYFIDTQQFFEVQFSVDSMKWRIDAETNAFFDFMNTNFSFSNLTAIFLKTGR